MVRYLDWAQSVLRVVLRDRPPEYGFGIAALAGELELPYDTLPDAERNALILAFDRVLIDLSRWGFVIYNHSAHSIGYPPAARRYRTEQLSASWSELGSGYLDADEEVFLRCLAAMSEVPGESIADVVPVQVKDIFDRLRWPWDVHRAMAVSGPLNEGRLVEGRIHADGGELRVTYAGLVRALDETGNLLREAEEHYQAHRLRAAGCIAAVELERRLKQLVGGPLKVSRKRDPGLEDYNKAAFDARLIDQESWVSISTLAVIRKRCVHVLDREPQAEEVRLLLDGVERILRRYPRA